MRKKRKMRMFWCAKLWSDGHRTRLPLGKGHRRTSKKFSCAFLTPRIFYPSEPQQNTSKTGGGSWEHSKHRFEFPWCLEEKNQGKSKHQGMVWCAKLWAFFKPSIRPRKPNALMCLNLPTKDMSEIDAKSTLTDAKRTLTGH